MSGERKAPAAQDGDDEMSVVKDAAAENAVDKPLLQCKGLNFKYSLKGKLVLKDINVSIGKGQRVLLLGGNGAGKSTLLKIFAGKHLIQDAEIFSCAWDQSSSGAVQRPCFSWRLCKKNSRLCSLQRCLRV